jgi:Fe-S-cluster-containing hydrogenase component 2
MPRCPEHAISEPDDIHSICYIDEDKCVGCGICADNCPLGIVEKVEG